ncbi:hypothetical protein ACX1C1_13670 [Paenibacillus sp. strain BS8-2]
MRMWVTLLVLLSSAVIYLWDGRTLLKRRQWRDWLFFTLLLTAASALCIYESESLSLPSPIPFLTRVLSPASTAIEQWSKLGSE